jgi:glycine C-acetyltransferase
MPHDRLAQHLSDYIGGIDEAGTAKRCERVIRAVLPATGGKGPRYLLDGHGDKPFLRMNANNYLGLSLNEDMIAADESATRQFGTGPGAVRFISGTWAPHIALEKRLAAFYGREAAMIYSSAYAAVMGLLPSLITPETAVISDELNHNCIINAIRLAAPKEKRIYRHLALDELEAQLLDVRDTCRRAIIVTDGVFSMRGDHAPLDEIVKIAQAYDAAFLENVLVIVDDSHGVGAFGATGRGTEEITNSGPVDLLISTLGKALGANGGYVVASRAIIDYMRETSPFYIYSNPITPGEAAAAATALDILDSPRGAALLTHLHQMKAQFEQGLRCMGLETISGEHPVTPLMIRDSSKTNRMVRQLFERGILATGLAHPVVPRGDEEIRFQICADHTSKDIEEALDAICVSLS